MEGSCIDSAVACLRGHANEGGSPACGVHNDGAHLLVGVHIDMALDALLPHVGPGVAAHPLPLALGALVLSEAALLALVWGQSLTLGACLKNRSRTGMGLLGSKGHPRGPSASCPPSPLSPLPSPPNKTKAIHCQAQLCTCHYHRTPRSVLFKSLNNQSVTGCVILHK